MARAGGTLSSEVAVSDPALKPPARPAVYRLAYTPPPRAITVEVGGHSRHTLHPVTGSGRRTYAPLLVDDEALHALRASPAAPYLREAVRC